MTALFSSDWTLVTLKKRSLFKEALSTIITTTPLPKKRVTPESLQVLIRTRLHQGLTQQEADHLCSFPRHTFNKIESHLMVPTGEQQSHIQRHLGVSLLLEP
jgi:hypothetical protein